MTDLALIRQAQAGDRHATDLLVRRWTPLARKVAYPFYLPGADRDDVHQEAMVGLLKGIRAYRPGHGTTVAQFLAGCIRRHLISRVTMACALKHRPLTRAAGGDTLLHVAASSTPEAIVEQRDHTSRLLQACRDRLSPLERRAVLGVAAGYTYAELGGDPRTLDNACQRARRKLRDAA